MNNDSWTDFCHTIENIYQKTKFIDDGKVADYIPQLAKANPNLYGVSVYTLDGREYHIGDHDYQFCIQSCSKPISYLLALEEHGLDYVSNHIGKEPSGCKFNSFRFNDENKPFNPLINAGAIMACSLIKPNERDDLRYNHIMDTWKKIVGDKNVEFDNTVYLSEKLTAYRNNALANIMMENGIFPEGTDIEKTLQLYFQACSIKMNTCSLAKCAAMLCNGGVIDNKEVFSAEICKYILCIMYQSGMYDYSGRWGFDIGLPAKSGVSGAIFTVIPNVGGICTFSPRLDKNGNSVRGVHFFTELVKHYRLHIFDLFSNNIHSKKTLIQSKTLFDIGTSSTYKELETYLLQTEEDINKIDYDGRSLLHVLIDEKKYDSIFVLLKHHADYKLKDRWGTSLDKDQCIQIKIVLLYYLKYKMTLKSYFLRW